MGPKQNAKAVAGNAKKAEVQKQKDAVKQAEKDAQEAAEWGRGAKDRSKAEQEEAKRQEALRKKAEREALLAEEEASIKSAKSSTDKLAKKREAKNDQFAKESGADVQKFAASGLDDALDLLAIVTEGKGPSEVQGLDRHPERRMKSAYAEFEEREMPLLKAENPGLRLSQLKQALQKKWKKHPDNPMNQQNVAFNATKEEVKELVSAAKEKTLNRLEK